MGDEELNIQDPSQIGTGGITGLRFNADRIKSSANVSDEFLSNFNKQLDESNAIRNKALHEFQNDEAENAWMTQFQGGVGEEYSDYGNSIYDNEVKTKQDLQDLNELRAREQGWLPQLASGVGKMGVLTLTTAADFTIGSICGLVEMGKRAYNGESAANVWAGLYDNSFSRAMREINEDSEKWMPNYKTKEEQNGAWHPLTMNFWADTILKNAGYTLGTMLGMGVSAMLTGGTSIGAQLGQGIGKAIAKSTGKSLAKCATYGEKVAVNFFSAWNEGRSEAGNAVDEMLKKNNMYYQTNDIREERKREFDALENWRKEQLSKANAPYNPESPTVSLSKEYIEEQYNLQKNKLNEKYDKLDSIYKAGNAIQIMNTAYLMATGNGANLRFYGSSFGNATRNANIMKKLFGTNKGKYGAGFMGTDNLALTRIADASKEFSEEINQSFISNFAENYWAAGYNEGGRKKILSFGEALNKGFSESWGNSDTYVEGFAGFLTGLSGTFSPHKVKDENGNDKWKWWQGGIFDKEGSEEFRRSQEVANYLNEVMDRQKLHNGYIYNVRAAAFDDEKEMAAYNGDKFDFENARWKGIANDVLFHKAAGKLDEYRNMIGDPDKEVTDEEIDNLIRLTTGENPDGTILNALGLQDINGNELSNKQKKDLKDKIKNYRKEVQEAIDLLDKRYDEIDEKTGYHLSNDELAILTTMSSFSDNFMKRTHDMAKEINDKYGSYLNPIKSAYEAKIKELNDRYDKLSDKEKNSTKGRELQAYAKAFEKNVEALNKMNEIQQKIASSSDGRAFMGDFDEYSEFTNAAIQNAVNRGFLDEKVGNEILTLLNDMQKCNIIEKSMQKQFSDYVSKPWLLEQKLDIAFNKVKNRDLRNDIKKEKDIFNNLLKEFNEAKEDEVDENGNNKKDSARRKLRTFLLGLRNRHLLNDLEYSERLLNGLLNDGEIGKSIQDLMKQASTANRIEELIRNNQSLTQEERIRALNVSNNHNNSVDTSDEMLDESQYDEIAETIRNGELDFVDANGEVLRSQLGKNLDASITEEEIEQFREDNQLYFFNKYGHNKDNYEIDENGNIVLKDEINKLIDDEARRAIYIQTLGHVKKMISLMKNNMSEEEKFTEEMLKNISFEEYDRMLSKVDEDAYTKENTTGNSEVEAIESSSFFDSEKYKQDFDKYKKAIENGRIIKNAMKRLSDIVSRQLAHHVDFDATVTQNVAMSLAIIDKVFNCDSVLSNPELFYAVRDEKDIDDISVFLNALKDSDYKIYLSYLLNRKRYLDDKINSINVDFESIKKQVLNEMLKHHRHRIETYKRSASFREKIEKEAERIAYEQIFTEENYKIQKELKSVNRNLNSILKTFNTIIKQIYVLNYKREEMQGLPHQIEVDSDSLFNKDENSDSKPSNKMSLIADFFVDLAKKMNESGLSDNAEASNFVSKLVQENFDKIINAASLDMRTMTAVASSETSDATGIALSMAQMSTIAPQPQTKQQTQTVDEKNEGSDGINGEDQQQLGQEANESVSNVAPETTISNDQSTEVFMGTTQYDSEFLEENGIARNVSEKYFEKDSFNKKNNIEYDPREDEEFLNGYRYVRQNDGTVKLEKVVESAFEFVNSGKLQDVYENGKYKGRIYVISNDEQNGLGDNSHNKNRNFYFSIRINGKWTPTFFAYEGARIKLGINGDGQYLILPDNLKLRKDSNGKNIPINTSNEMVEVEDVEGNVTQIPYKEAFEKYSNCFSEKDRNPLKKFFFAVKLDDGTYQPIGLVPRLKNDDGESSTKIYNDMLLKFQNKLNTLYSQNNKELAKLYGVNQIQTNEAYKRFNSEMYWYYKNTGRDEIEVTETIKNVYLGGELKPRPAVIVKDQNGDEYIYVKYHNDDTKSAKPVINGRLVRYDGEAEITRNKYYKSFDSLCKLREDGTTAYDRDKSDVAFDVSNEFKLQRIFGGIYIYNKKQDGGYEYQNLNSITTADGKTFNELIDSGDASVGVVTTNEGKPVVYLIDNGDIIDDISQYTNNGQQVFKEGTTIIALGKKGNRKLFGAIPVNYNTQMSGEVIDDLNGEIDNTVNYLKELKDINDENERNRAVVEAFSGIKNILYMPFGEKSGRTINIFYNKEDDTLTLKCSFSDNPSNNIDRKVDINDDLGNELKTFFAQCNLAFNIDANTINKSKESAKSVISSGILRTNLKSLSPVNTRVSLSKRNSNLTESDERKNDDLKKQQRKPLTSINLSKESSTKNPSLPSISDKTIKLFDNTYSVKSGGLILKDGIEMSADELWELTNKLNLPLGLDIQVFMIQVSSKEGDIVDIDTLFDKYKFDKKKQVLYKENEGNSESVQSTQGTSTEETLKQKESEFENDGSLLGSKKRERSNNRVREGGRRGSKKRLIDKNYEKADIQKELDWLSDNMPWLSLGERVQIIKHLENVVKNGNSAWGLYQDGCIYLSSSMSRGTLYHEAYHAVFDLCLSNDEQNELFDELRQSKKYSLMSNDELEEVMAEKFRQYIETRTYDLSIGNKILNWFKELFQKIFHFRHYPYKMNALFNRINNGSYKSNFNANKYNFRNIKNLNNDIRIKNDISDISYNDFKELPRVIQEKMNECL